MLDSIRLVNFKCFADITIGCSSINLLCGLNGMGKSSVIQALLVLHQSFQSGELLDGRLVLGADLADIGTGADVLFEDATEDMVTFELSDSRASKPWHLAFDYSRSADQLVAEPKRKHRPPSYVPKDWRPLAPFGGPLIYVNAERIGPRKWHTRSETFARRRQLGPRGEYAINFLNERKSDLLPENDRRAPNPGQRRILDVLDFWLQEITPGAHLELQPVQSADALIAGFTFDRPNDVSSRRYRATNVGFGLSYVLPVLLALLAPAGSLALVENPEAHLHPRGQTKLGELAARAAISGLQLFVETHSDHFMDGVRIAVRDALISPTQVRFHYFSREDSKSRVTSPKIDAGGRLSSWPVGFFDQHDENLARLLAPKVQNA